MEETKLSTLKTSKPVEMAAPAVLRAETIKPAAAPVEPIQEKAKVSSLEDLHVVLKSAPAGKSSCAFDAGTGKTRYAFQIELEDGKPKRVAFVNGQPGQEGWNGLTVEDFMAAGFVRF